MPNSIVALFAETVQKRGGDPAARFKDAKGEWVKKSWKEMNEDRKVIASGLLSLGIEAKERVNVLANTSYRLVLADLAIQSCGATPVAIYQSNLPNEVEYIVNDCGGVIVFADDKTQLEKLQKEKEKLKNVRKVVVLSDETDGTPWTIGWSELERLGKEKFKENEEKIEARTKAVEPSDILTLIYTSGTTGMPKGVVLPHSAMLYEAEAISKIGLVRPDDCELLFLPLAHSFAKVLECAWFGVGHEMAIDYDTNKITQNMALVRPTLMAAVPRIFEKVYSKVTASGLESPGMKGKLFKWALDLNDRYAQHMTDGTSVPVGLQLQLNLAKSLVFSKIQARLTDTFGGRIRYFISGGAPLSKRIAFFFANAGVVILEGYGLTETSAATTVNRLEKNKIGTVGSPIPGTEVKIAPDGEILIRGPGVMREYWGKPEATKDAINAEGWFATGDIGVVDEDGYVRITDRKKDIIVTAGGKNVAPQNIEGMLKAASPLISQSMIYGDKRKYLVALVTLEPENLTKLAKEKNVSGSYQELCRSEMAKTAVKHIIDQVNGQLPSYETIKTFKILEKDFEIGDELTPTLKVKRKHASAKYQKELDSMYDEKVVD